MAIFGPIFPFFGHFFHLSSGETKSIFRPFFPIFRPFFPISGRRPDLGSVQGNRDRNPEVVFNFCPHGTLGHNSLKQGSATLRGVDFMKSHGVVFMISHDQLASAGHDLFITDAGRKVAQHEEFLVTIADLLFSARTKRVSTKGVSMIRAISESFP